MTYPTNTTELAQALLDFFTDKQWNPEGSLTLAGEPCSPRSKQATCWSLYHAAQLCLPGDAPESARIHVQLNWLFEESATVSCLAEWELVPGRSFTDVLDKLRLIQESE